MLAALEPAAAAGDGIGTRRLIALAAAALGLAGFVWAERRSPDPLLPFDLFAEAPFAAGSAAAFFSGAAMFGALSTSRSWSSGGAGPTRRRPGSR